MIIVIGSQKGGVGKSTIAINIAGYLCNKGNDIVLVDADIQKTASRWVNDRQKTNFKKINCVQKYGDIKNTLIDLNSRYEYVIVDVAGKDSKELRTAMLTAQILIVPFRPSQMDLDTIGYLNSVIETAKLFNKKLNVYALLNLSPSNPRITEAIEAQDYLSEYPHFKLLKTIVRERKIYRDVVPQGKSVCDGKYTKAQEEINDLCEEVLR